MVEFVLSDEQVALQRLARDFVKRELKPVVMEREKIQDPKERMPWDLVEKASKLGLRTLPYPTEYGGGGQDVLTLCVVGEELAAGDLGFSVILDQTWKLAHILSHGTTKEQRDRFLPELCSDHRFLTAICLTESGCGSDHQGLWDDPSIALNTTAKPEGNEYVINGSKQFISNGGVAKLYVLAARLDLTKKLTESLTGFLVPADTPGFRVGQFHKKIGQRLVMNAELFFDNMRVPRGNLLLGEGRMMEIRARLLACGKPEAAATTLGVGRAAFEDALEYSQQRVQGGKPLIEHQTISYMLADMAIRISAARNMIWRSAWAVDNTDPYDPKLGWMCKVFASE
ncbi:MAG: acyl-CoA dehydrogenase family protein, partial [Nitrospinota bacterium]